MTLYDIDRAIESWTPEVDEATGEILNIGYFDELAMARDEKIENIALYVKNLVAEGKAIREEEKALAERRRALENKADRLKRYLVDSLAGEKFSTPRVALTYRRSTAVEIDDGFVEWAKISAPALLTFKEPEPNKAIIKDFLATHELASARIVEHENLQIK